jgi:hypothetical protein
MKALFIIASCFALAFVLKALDLLTSRREIKSVGGKANRNSRNMAHFDISDENEVRKAMEEFKDLAD